ncbi:hypothetical protein B7755_006555 [Streptomyces sp. NBS 14/10]|uniref:SCO4225 family membrane protein n=1 Tax=Streptomyces sp. NBS 14/10 TaxID=1945643 RepID=UPI00211B2D2C|nr:hypothetical protein [Streptomyces sp. NBS 14/10]KAK1177859.1 hypothetical protein B7755_006555 [Streptomyces sp. NBS 14/10]
MPILERSQRPGHPPYGNKDTLQAATFSAASAGDASFAGVWAILVTAPTSMLFFFAGPAGLIGIPIGAIVQAAALGALYRYITERRARSTESGVSNA